MPQPSTEFATDTQRWDALRQRNPLANRAFVYGVKTTGIYCRPTCSSRLPKPDHVQFFQSYTDAEQAGFRPCKRCTPNTSSPHDRQVQLIADICKQIEASEEPPALKELAIAAGLSQFHFHRLFKAIVGVTPKAYVAAQRAKRVRTELHQGTSVTEAIYEAGFATSSSFYEGATTMLGMKPTEYKRGADGIEIQFAVASCSLGYVLVAATARGICAIDFADTPDDLIQQLHDRFPKAQILSSRPDFDRRVEQVVAFVDRPQQGLDLPLDIRGTAFQQQVWQALQEIPPGSTASYADIAERIGNPKAVRAVARACATNQIAVAIPCHRVIGSQGTLTGYRWGLERKQALLTREAEG